MKHLKLYENFKVKNITQDDVIKCIKGGGVLFATIIKNFPKNNPKDALRPVSIDDDGLITVELDGKEYELELKNVDKIDMPELNEKVDYKQIGDNFIIYGSDYTKDVELKNYILENIEEMLTHFHDEDFIIKVGYDLPIGGDDYYGLPMDYHAWSRNGKFAFNIGGKVFNKVDAEYISTIDEFLRKEGFIGVGQNILKEVDIKARNVKGKMEYVPISRFVFNTSKESNIDWITFTYIIPSKMNELHSNLDNDHNKRTYKSYKDAITAKLNSLNNKSLMADDFEMIKWEKAFGVKSGNKSEEKFELDHEFCEYLLGNLDITKQIQDELLEIIQDAKDDYPYDIDIILQMIKPLGLYKKEGEAKGFWKKEEAIFQIIIPCINSQEGGDLRKIVKIFSDLTNRLDGMGEVYGCEILSRDGLFDQKLRQVKFIIDKFGNNFELLIIKFASK